LLKLVLNETDSQLAERLWQSWLTTATTPVGPYLLPFEITAVLRKQVFRGAITREYGLAALQRALAFEVTLLAFPDLYERAWKMAEQLHRPTAYDSHYLALAEMLNCEFWTANRKLYRASREHLPWIRWLGDYPG
jgi:predicted nucleic acid-binding protein